MNIRRSIAIVLVLVGFVLLPSQASAETPPQFTGESLRCFEGAYGTDVSAVLGFAVCSVLPSITAGKAGRYTVPGAIGGSTGRLTMSGAGSWSGGSQAAVITVGPYDNDPTWGDVPTGFIMAMHTVATNVPALSTSPIAYDTPIFTRNAIVATAITMDQRAWLGPPAAPPASNSCCGTIRMWLGLNSFSDLEYIAKPASFPGGEDFPQGAACGMVVGDMYDGDGDLIPRIGHSGYDVSPTMEHDDLVLKLTMPAGYPSTSFKFRFRWSTGAWLPLPLSLPVPAGGTVEISMGATVPGPRVLSQFQLECENQGQVRWGTSFGSPTDREPTIGGCQSLRLVGPEFVVEFLLGETYTFFLSVPDGVEFESDIDRLAVRVGDELGWIRNLLTDADELLLEDVEQVGGSTVAIPFSPMSGQTYEFDWTPSVTTHRDRAGLVCHDDSWRNNLFGVVYPFSRDYGNDLGYLDPEDLAREETCMEQTGMELTSPSSWVRGIGRMASCLVQFLFVPDADAVSDAWSGLSSQMDDRAPTAWVTQGLGSAEAVVHNMDSELEASTGDCIQWLPDYSFRGVTHDGQGFCLAAAVDGTNWETFRYWAGAIVWAFFGISMIALGLSLLSSKSGGST
jgi:hypothetical protein